MRSRQVHIYVSWSLCAALIAASAIPAFAASRQANPDLAQFGAPHFHNLCEEYGPLTEARVEGLMDAPNPNWFVICEAIGELEMKGLSGRLWHECERNAMLAEDYMRHGDKKISDIIRLQTNLRILRSLIRCGDARAYELAVEAAKAKKAPYAYLGRRDLEYAIRTLKYAAVHLDKDVRSVLMDCAREAYDPRNREVAYGELRELELYFYLQGDEDKADQYKAAQSALMQDIEVRFTRPEVIRSPECFSYLQEVFERIEAIKEMCGIR